MKNIEIRNIRYEYEYRYIDVVCILYLSINEKTFEINICSFYSNDSEPFIDIGKDNDSYAYILNELEIDFERFEKLIIHSFKEFNKKGFNIKINP